MVEAALSCNLICQTLSVLFSYWSSQESLKVIILFFSESVHAIYLCVVYREKNDEGEFFKGIFIHFLLTISTSFKVSILVKVKI